MRSATTSVALCMVVALGAIMLFGCSSRRTAHSHEARPIAALAAVSEPVLESALEAPLSVISFNMQHRNRPRELDAMSDRLKSDRARLPDFILCQEVVFKRYDSFDRYDTATELAKRLGLHSRGTKRTSDREGVAIISRYPFSHYDSLHLDARTNGLLLGFRRVSVMGEFEVPGVGLVRVVDVHFAHWPFEGHVRREQLTETLEWIASRERRVPADVTILGGDFNAKPGHAELAPLHDRAVTGGLVYHDWNDTELPTKGSPGRPVKRIDYIFVAAPSRRVSLTGEEALWSDGLRRRNGSRFWPSDHVPLLHDYSIRTLALTGVDE